MIKKFIKDCSASEIYDNLSINENCENIDLLSDILSGMLNMIKNNFSDIEDIDNNIFNMSFEMIKLELPQEILNIEFKIDKEV